MRPLATKNEETKTRKANVQGSLRSSSLQTGNQGRNFLHLRPTVFHRKTRKPVDTTITTKETTLLNSSECFGRLYSKPFPPNDLGLHLIIVFWC